VVAVQIYDLYGFDSEKLEFQFDHTVAVFGG